jgi:hypothetical protein
MNTSCKNPNCKVLAHLGLRSNVLPGLLTDVSVWVEFCKEMPQQSVKMQIRYLRLGSINIPCKFLTAKFLPTWRLCQSISQAFNWHKCFDGICISHPEQGVTWCIQKALNFQRCLFLNCLIKHTKYMKDAIFQRYRFYCLKNHNDPQNSKGQVDTILLVKKFFKRLYIDNGNKHSHKFFCIS